MMLKVSVLVPVFNVERYVSDAIDSILNQSYENIEIIIVDDSSTDGTYNICKKKADEHQNIILLRNDFNRGISDSLNLGLSYCSGDYISRADGDDIVEPHRIEMQVKYLESNQNCGLVGCWVKNINESGEIIGECKYPISNADIIKCIKYTSPVLHIWTARKEVYTLLGGYRKTNPAEDYDFILRCIFAGVGLANIPYFGSLIRLRNGGTISSGSLKQKKMFDLLLKKFNAGVIEDFDNVQTVYECGEFTVKLHQLSVFFLKKGLEGHRGIARYFFVLLSLISPYTVKDIYRRVRFRVLVKKSNRKKQMEF
ncbi:glycosyltransferase family 2 protein [Plesiomonas shigelloides]|uniref:glycosyltransferase family 2 protein n=1 Tax=Plesiomonas shigelloides TaxID=703 RepID=UPI003EB6AF6C